MDVDASYEVEANAEEDIIWREKSDRHRFPIVFVCVPAIKDDIDKKKGKFKLDKRVGLMNATKKSRV